MAKQSLHKRKTILAEAEKLFNRFGIKKTAVDDIARFSNVAKGTIYNYFENKEGIIKALVLEKISIFESGLNKAFKRIKQPAEKMRLTLLERLRITTENPFISENILNETEIEKINLMLDDLDDKVLEIIDSIIDSSTQHLPPDIDKKRIHNFFRFAMKGMNETIKDRLEPLTAITFEKDIDFLLNLVFKKNEKM